MDEIIKQYLLEGGRLFSITNIDTIRDGGTKVLICSGDERFYIHKENFTIHNGYPLSDENIIKNIYTNSYIIDRLNKYSKDINFKLSEVESIISNVSLQGIRDRKIDKILNEDKNIF